MKRKFVCFLLAICFACGMVVPAFAGEAGTALPNGLCLLSAEYNGIASPIVLVTESENTEENQTEYCCNLFLPNTAVVENCFFAWDGGLDCRVENANFESGLAAVPAVGASVSYCFQKADQTVIYTVTTYQSSETIPAIFLEIDEEQGSIADMNASEDHSVTCTGNIVIDGVRMELDTIKGRGNSTWSPSIAKKPYNIKLAKKAKLLGMDAKTKKWSLLANYTDPSLLRNKVGYDLANEMGIGQESRLVDVWMNGEYLGNYLITAKTDSFVTDTGLLVEDDNYQDAEDENFTLDGLDAGLFSDNRITVKENNTGMTTEELQSYMQELWDAIRSESGYNEKGKYYTDYIDMTSWAKMYLLHEYCKSYDVAAGSLFMHRDGNTEEDKLIAGPVWDLDNAFGCTTLNPWLGTDVASADGLFICNVGDSKTCWLKKLGQHEDFMQAVTEVYLAYKDYFDAIPAHVTELSEELADSAAMNFVRRPISETMSITCTRTLFLKRKIGTPYEQNYKKTETWSDYLYNLTEYTRVRSIFFANHFKAELAKEDTPTAVYTPLGDTCGELSGLTTSTKYSLDGGRTWKKATEETVALEGVSPSYGIRVIALGDGVTTVDSDVQYIEVAEYEPIVCSKLVPALLSEGQLKLYVDGHDMGLFTFRKGNNGWSIQRSDGKYLSVENGALVYKNAPVYWAYSNGKFSKTLSVHNGWFGLMNFYCTYYLSQHQGELALSLDSKTLPVALYERVNSTAHAFGAWKETQKGTHVRVCADCGKIEVGNCEYEGGICVDCGGCELVDATVTLDVSVKKVFSFFRMVDRVKLKPMVEGGEISMVSYSLNHGLTWSVGRTFLASGTESVEVRVTVKNGRTYEFHYENGLITEK